jgi:hypothetical protein
LSYEIDPFALELNFYFLIPRSSFVVDVSR